MTVVTGRGMIQEGRGEAEGLELEPEQPVELDDEGAIFQLGKAPRGQRVALLVVDDEQLTARLIFPPQPDVAADGVIARVVLHQRAHKHRGAEGIGGASGHEVAGERPLRELNPVDG